jgi:hypothetical protein
VFDQEATHGWVFERDGTHWAIGLDGVQRRVQQLGPVVALADHLAHTEVLSGPWTEVGVPLLYRLGDRVLAETLTVKWRQPWSSFRLAPPNPPGKWPSAKYGPRPSRIVQRWLTGQYGEALGALVQRRPDEVEARLVAIEAAMHRLDDLVVDEPPDVIAEGQEDAEGYAVTLPRHIAFAREANRTPLEPVGTLVGDLQRLVRTRRVGGLDWLRRGALSQPVPELLALARDDGGRYTRQLDFVGLEHDHIVRVGELAVQMAFEEMERRLLVVDAVNPSAINNDMEYPAKRAAAATALTQIWEASGKPETLLQGIAQVLRDDRATNARLTLAADALADHRPEGWHVSVDTAALELTEALIARLATPPSAGAESATQVTRCTLGKALARWSPSRAATASAVAAAQLAEPTLIRHPDTAACLGALVAALVELGDPDLLPLYARALTTQTQERPPWPDSTTFEDWLAPLWRFPAHPALKTAAAQLFAPGTAWQLAAGMATGTMPLSDLLTRRGLFTYPAFRAQVLDLLADRRVLGVLTTGTRQYDFVVAGTHFGSDLRGADFPKTVTTQTLRQADFAAYLLTRGGSLFPIRPYWPTARRDRALAELAARLRTGDWP